MFINEYGDKNNPLFLLLAPMMVSGEDLYQLMHEELYGGGDRSSAEGCGLFGSYKRSPPVQALDHGAGKEIREETQ